MGQGVRVTGWVSSRDPHALMDLMANKVAPSPFPSRGPARDLKRHSQKPPCPIALTLRPTSCRPSMTGVEAGKHNPEACRGRIAGRYVIFHPPSRGANAHSIHIHSGCLQVGAFAPPCGPEWMEPLLGNRVPAIAARGFQFAQGHIPRHHSLTVIGCNVMQPTRAYRCPHPYA